MVGYELLKLLIFSVDEISCNVCTSMYLINFCCIGWSIVLFVLKCLFCKIAYIVSLFSVTDLLKHTYVA